MSAFRNKFKLVSIPSQIYPEIYLGGPLDWCPWGWSSQWEVLVYTHSSFEVIIAIAGNIIIVHAS